jgi:LL-diaminopimelate aminotransferase
VTIELSSFSKTDDFARIRCAFAVIPKTVTAVTNDGSHHPVHPLWNRRNSIKFNGVSYIVQRGVQRGAEAA